MLPGVAQNCCKILRLAQTCTVLAALAIPRLICGHGMLRLGGFVGWAHTPVGQQLWRAQKGRACPAGLQQTHQLWAALVPSLGMTFPSSSRCPFTGFYHSGEGVWRLCAMNALYTVLHNIDADLGSIYSLSNKLENWAPKTLCPQLCRCCQSRLPYRYNRILTRP